MVKLLLAKDDIEADHKDSGGLTPLSIASSRGYEGIVKLLLARPDVDINSKDVDGETPLYKACLGLQDGVLKLLLARENIEINHKVMKDLSSDSWGVRDRMQYEARAILDLLFDAADERGIDTI